MDGVLRTALDGKKGGITWRLQESLEDMEYADDGCLVSHKYKHMQRKLDDLWKESNKVGLEINSSNTEEIRVNTTVNQGLRLNGEDIKRSSEFYYLGSILLLLQSALQPLVGFGLLYDFVPQSSIFTLLSPISHFHLL